MEARGKNLGFGFPGYDGYFPKAMRSSRGRGEGPRKIKDCPKDMCFFELLATVAGQLLQDEEDGGKTGSGGPEHHEIFKSDAGTRGLGNTKEELSKVMAINEDAFQEKDHPSEFCKVKDDFSKSNDLSALSYLENMDTFVLQQHEYDTSRIMYKSFEAESGNLWDDTNYKHSTPVPCHGNSEDRASIEMDVDIDTRKESEPGGTKAPGEGTKAPGESIMSELQQNTATSQADRTSHKLGHCFLDTKGIGIGREDSQLDHDDFLTVARHDDSPTLVSSDSSGEAPLFIEQKTCESTDLRMMGGSQELSCLKDRDTDDNSSESIVLKTVLTQTSRHCYTKTSKAKRCANKMTKKRVLGTRSKRKRDDMEAKASIASSPGTSSNSSAKKSGESHVKLSIKSFTVPELFVDLPESATISNLKTAVMEEAMNLLGGGLRVRVLLQGKKVLDETASLLQVGISSTGDGDALGFMLEPNPVPNSTSAEDPLLVLSCAANQAASRYSILSKDSAVSRGSSKGHAGMADEMMEIDANSAETQEQPTAKSVKGDSSTYGQDSSKAVIPGSRALILRAGHGGNGLQGLAVVPLGQTSQNMEIGKRRIRRPFSVTEVEALVEAVEKLGTGRWRDVKLQAFSQAKHRTYVDLKDKWKTLVHTASIAPQQRRGEPVPQGLLDRVIHAHAYWTAHQAKQQTELSLEANIP